MTAKIDTRQRQIHSKDRQTVQIDRQRRQKIDMIENKIYRYHLKVNTQLGWKERYINRQMN